MLSTKKSVEKQIEGPVVIIYLAAHGAEGLARSTENNEVPEIDVSLLSFAGYSGLVGLMMKCNGKPIDHHTLDELREYYKQPTITDWREDFTRTLHVFLKDLYAECDIAYEGGGFVVENNTNMTLAWDRTFLFKANEHETCRACTEHGNTKRCMIERNPKLQYCPDYGPIVVASSEAADKPFTIVGSNNTIANLNLLGINESGELNSTGRYWLQRAGLRLDNGEIFGEDLELVVAARMIFIEKVCNLKDVVIFFKAMGFKIELVLDPSCRAIHASEFETQDPDNPQQTTYSDSKALHFTTLYREKENALIHLPELYNKYKKYWKEFKILKNAPGFTLSFREYIESEPKEENSFTEAIEYLKSFFIKRRSELSQQARSSELSQLLKDELLKDELLKDEQLLEAEAKAEAEAEAEAARRGEAEAAEAEAARRGEEAAREEARAAAEEARAAAEAEAREALRLAEEAAREAEAREALRLAREAEAREAEAREALRLAREAEALILQAKKRKSGSEESGSEEPGSEEPGSQEPGLKKRGGKPRKTRKTRKPRKTRKTRKPRKTRKTRRGY